MIYNFREKCVDISISKNEAVRISKTIHDILEKGVVDCDSTLDLIEIINEYMREEEEKEQS